MAQFDLYRNPRAGAYPLLLDIQSELLAQLETRVVVPLARRDRYSAPVIGRAIPIVAIDGDEYALVVPLLAAVTNILGTPVGSLAAHRANIVTAVDPPAADRDLGHLAEIRSNATVFGWGRQRRPR